MRIGHYWQGRLATFLLVVHTPVLIAAGNAENALRERQRQVLHETGSAVLAARGASADRAALAGQRDRLKVLRAHILELVAPTMSAVPSVTAGLSTSTDLALSQPVTTGMVSEPVPGSATPTNKAQLRRRIEDLLEQLVPSVTLQAATSSGNGNAVATNPAVTAKLRQLSAEIGSALAMSEAGYPALTQLADRLQLKSSQPIDAGIDIEPTLVSRSRHRRAIGGLSQ